MNRPNSLKGCVRMEIFLCGPLRDKTIYDLVTTPNKARLKVFRYSFSEAIPIFFNRLKSVFFLARSL